MGMVDTLKPTTEFLGMEAYVGINWIKGKSILSHNPIKKGDGVSFIWDSICLMNVPSKKSKKQVYSVQAPSLSPWSQYY